jgi:hypothetical protein
MGGSRHDVWQLEIIVAFNIIQAIDKNVITCCGPSSSDS